MLIRGLGTSLLSAGAQMAPRAASGQEDTFTPSAELPFPRFTTFTPRTDGYRQLDRVQHGGAWQLDLPEGRLILCQRGTKLTAFDGQGRLRWEDDANSSAHTQNTTICPESNTAYVFPYGGVMTLDLTTGKNRNYKSLGNWGRTVFGTQQGQLLSLDNRRIHLYDENLELVHETEYGFGHSRADYDRDSGLITLQGENRGREENRHAVYTDRGVKLLDEASITIHPGVPDGSGGLLQVVSDPQGERWEALRIRDGEVTRFPVEPGTVIAFPLQDGNFATLSESQATMRNASGEVLGSRELPGQVVSLTATPEGPLLGFSDRVMRFDGELREVHQGPALTAALRDGSFLVVTPAGVAHHRGSEIAQLGDVWTAREKLGPLASYREALPIVNLRGRQGWESLMADAERELGAEPPDTLGVRLRAGTLEIQRASSEEQTRQRLGLPAQDWPEWKTPIGPEVRERNQLSRHALIGEKPSELDHETWRQAVLYAGYRDQPSSVSSGQHGYWGILGLGTVAGDVSLVHTGPQGPRYGDRLPGAVVRTQLTPNGLVAADELGNLMSIEPPKWGNGIEPRLSCNPDVAPPGTSKNGVEMTETAVQVGGVRLKRRESKA